MPVFDSTTQAKSSVLIRPGPSSSAAAATIAGEPGTSSIVSGSTSMSSSSAPTVQSPLAPHRDSTRGSSPLLEVENRLRSGYHPPPYGRRGSGVTTAHSTARPDD